MVNTATAPGNVLVAIAVNPAVPGRIAGRVVFFRPFLFQHRLRPAITALLPPISAHRIAPVMPDYRRRAEAECPTVLLQPPTHIHIIARHPEQRIKTADGTKPAGSEGHVAAWDMFGFALRD